MSPSPPLSSGFRDDIQGMRAIAVLTVIAGHAGLTFVPGGYVGVDVFFVISGFLITQLLLKEATRSGRVSLSTFYARRARRILPAAGLVLVVTLAAATLWMSVLETIDLAKDALWASAFAVNVRFAQQGVDYFAAEAAPSPIQHYWSLAVEEQFYLVWPLMVGLCFWWAARRGHRHGVALRAVAVTILAIAVASFAWSLLRTAAEPQSAYFSSLTRAWELAVGAGVAVGVQGGRTLRGRAPAEVLAWSGLVAILLACVLYDEAVPFPGYAALLPVLGAAAVLYAGAGAGPRTSAARLLSIRPARVVGDWSYSLYLWHWPLLVVPVAALGRELTAAESVLAVVVTFVLSYLTYRYVETPFRTRRTWSRTRRTLVLYPAFLLVVGTTAGAAWAWSDYRVSEHGDVPAITTAAYGISGSGTVDLVRASAKAAEANAEIPSDLTPDLVDLEGDIPGVGDCTYEDGEDWQLCPRGDADAERSLVVVGDSHARAWIPAFEKIAAHSGWRTYYLVKPQCTGAFVYPTNVDTREPWPECVDFHEWTEDRITELEPDLVVVSSTAPTGVVDADGQRVSDREDLSVILRAGTADMLRTYEPLTERLVLLADVPRLTFDPAVCLSTPGARLGDCSSAPKAESAAITADSIELAAELGVESVDPEQWLCADDVCPTVVGSTIAYRDKGHISATRAEELGEPLGRALGIW